jgi:hypothetical protein
MAEMTTQALVGLNLDRRKSTILKPYANRLGAHPN